MRKRDNVIFLAMFAAALFIVTSVSGDDINLTTLIPGGYWQNESGTDNIYYDAGNVGIGTTSPVAPLSVSGVGGEVSLVEDTRAQLTATFNTGVLANPLNDREGFLSILGTNVPSSDSVVLLSEGDPGSGISFATRDASNNRGIRMTIKGDGKVGIGTATPQTKLHVYGSSGEVTSTIESDTGTPNLRLRTNLKDYRLHINSRNLEIVDATTGTEFSRFAIDTTGNVGIGTATPSGHMLDIASTAGTIDNSAIRARYPRGGRLLNAEFAALAHRDGEWKAVYAKGASGVGSSAIALYTDGEVNMMNGNVGIGTTSPASGYKLDVEGKIQAAAFDTGDITFSDQATQKILWRMFEDEEGLYLESIKTGKVYKFMLQEIDNPALKKRVEALEAPSRGQAKAGR